MRTRGRPRHPDILTPREWEVLSLLREGLSNPAIAERLGVSRDAVKYHVSQILWKLGVTSREEAAAWRPEPAAPERQLPAGLARAGRVGLFGAAGLAMAGFVTLGGAIVFSAVRGDEGDNETLANAASADDRPASATLEAPTPSPSPTAAAVAPPVDFGNGALGEVAYVKDGNLWVLDLDTGEDRLVVERTVATTFGTTPDDLAAFGPQWSADGQWVAFGIRNAVHDFTSVRIVRPGDALLQDASTGNRYYEWSCCEALLATSYSGINLAVPRDSFPADYYHGADSRFVTNVGLDEARWDPAGRRLAVAIAANVTWLPEGARLLAPPFGIAIVDPLAAAPTTVPGQTASGVTTVYETSEGDSPPQIHSWSPDGRYLLFSTMSDGVRELFVVPLEGGEAVSLGPGAPFASGAGWSADGRLAIVGGGDAWANLRVVQPDGAVLADFGNGFSYELEPSWAVDGSRIVYASGGETSSAAGDLMNSRIWVANADGSGAQRLTSDDAYADRYPKLSRDGSRVLFVRLDAATIANGGASAVPAQLWLMNADGSDQRKVGDLPAVDLTAEAGHVDWAQYFDWYRPGADDTPFQAAPQPSISPGLFAPGPTFPKPAADTPSPPFVID